MDSPIHVVAAIEEFANINKGNAASAFDCFVNEESDQSFHCVWYFLKDLFELRMKMKWMSHLWVYYNCFVPCLL